jgi:hypothetical protein
MELRFKWKADLSYYVTSPMMYLRIYR